MLLGGALTRQWGMMIAGAGLVTSVELAREVAQEGWAPQAIQDIVNKANSFAQPVGLGLMMFGALKLNFKTMTAGYALYKLGGGEAKGSLGSSAGGQSLFSEVLSMKTTELGGLMAMAGLSLVVWGTGLANPIVVAAGASLATAGGVLGLTGLTYRAIKGSGPPVPNYDPNWLDQPGRTPSEQKWLDEEKKTRKRLATGGSTTNPAIAAQLRSLGLSRHAGGPISRSGWYNLEAGEHVLTARQKQDRMNTGNGGGSGVTVVINHPVVREDSDLDALAERVWEAVRHAKRLDPEYTGVFQT